MTQDKMQLAEQVLEAVQPVKHAWREIGKFIVKGLAEVMDRAAARAALPNYLRGRYVHSHKGKARRQHAMPQWRAYWLGVTEHHRKKRLERERGTTNAELAVA